MSDDAASLMHAGEGGAASEDGDGAASAASGSTSEGREAWVAPWRQIWGYYGRLCGAFGWRYVAIVSLTYGVNQGVGEAMLQVLASCNFEVADRLREAIDVD